MSELPCVMGRMEVKDGSGMEGCSEAKHQLLCLSLLPMPSLQLGTSVGTSHKS